MQGRSEQLAQCLPFFTPTTHMVDEARVWLRTYVWVRLVLEQQAHAGGVAVPSCRMERREAIKAAHIDPARPGLCKKPLQNGVPPSRCCPVQGIAPCMHKVPAEYSRRRTWHLPMHLHGMQALLLLPARLSKRCHVSHAHWHIQAKPCGLLTKAYIIHIHHVQ